MNTTAFVADAADRIERSVVIAVPRERVWRALSNAETFGTWFGANLKGQAFEPGRRARGKITISGYEHVYFDVVVERLEPMSVFSYRWHPYAIDPQLDYAAETPTLVTFTLRDAPGTGTLLTVIESGFENLPPDRRQVAFRMNSQGWEGQMGNVVRHVTRVAE